MKLKFRFVLIASITALLTGLAIFSSGQFSMYRADQNSIDATIRGKSVLWNKIITNQLNQLSLIGFNMKSENTILKLMTSPDSDVFNELSMDWFEFMEDDVFTRLQIADAKGKVIFSSDGNFLGMTNKILVHKVLGNKKISSGLERDDSGQLVALAVAPLFHKGVLTGVGIIESNLHYALEDFKKSDGSEVFLLSDKNKLEYGTNKNMFQSFDLQLEEPGTKASLHGDFDNKVYNIIVQPIMNVQNQPIANLVSATDITEFYYSERRINVIVFFVIILGVAVIMGAMYFYINKLFKPLNNLMGTVYKISKGDVSARAEITSSDEIGELGEAVNNMAEKLQLSIEKERCNAESLKNQVLTVLDGVNQISKGDLTVEVSMFHDSEMICDLSEGIQKMLDSLHALVKQVQMSGVQVLLSATAISATSKEQEATVTEQAASTAEIMATVTEIASTSKELLGAMDDIRQVTESTADSAAEGNEALVSMEKSMDNMQLATDVIASKLLVLSEKADNINTVVTTINRVADQTNLLSLNAAIEAEKAGEYGRGFSVVASEIRRLADQTAVATWDIEQMVKEMLSAVSAGVMGMEKFKVEVKNGVKNVANVGSQLVNVIEQVQALLPRFESITESMRAQSIGAEQITDSMSQLNDAAIQTSKSIQQSNQTIEQLKEAAQDLQKGVSIFKIEE